MRIFATEGRSGYHLVDTGILRLTLERSEQRWEHLRLVLASSDLLRALDDAGWTVAGTWGLFTYLKRPVAGTPDPADTDADGELAAAR